MISRRHLIGSTLLSASGSASVRAAAAAEPTLTSKYAFEAHVSVASPLVIGAATIGLRRVVPITGGVLKGERLRGRVLPGGADWQVVRPDGVLDIEAKYTLQAEDGTKIMVTNKGMRHGPPEIIDKLTRGEIVDPALYYFRTCAQFEAPGDSAHAWLNRALFIGIGERTAKAAIIRFHQVL